MKRTVLLIFALFLILVNFSFQNRQYETLEHKTNFGNFVGVKDENSVVFRGIRYAQAPIGEKRFKVSELYEYDSKETVNATHFGPKCVQLPGIGSVDLSSSQSEDCLLLNIWAPESGLNNTENKLPVMVFIHGGAFLLGSGNEPFIDGKKYNENGAILVTLNYRLSVLGFLTYPFLTLENNGAEGNLGILDQRLALIWINKHISEFGGDPNNVLIFGESAGAVSVVFHLISKNENERGEKLFHKAIIMSTVDDSVIGNHCRDLSSSSVNYVKKLNCYDANSLEKSIDCLMNISVTDIVNSVGTLSDMRNLFWHTGDDISPCIDDHIFTSSALKKISFDNWNFDIPVMIGNTLDEGTLFTFLAFPFVGINDQFYESIIKTIYHDNDIEQILSLYPLTNQSATDAISTLVGDFYFHCYSRKLAIEVNEHPNTKVFRYLFTKRSESGNQKLGVFHASALPYMFHTTPGGFLFAAYLTDSEKQISLHLIQSYTNFAKSGDPNLPSSLPLYWPPYSNQSTPIFAFDDEYTVLSDFHAESCSFWETHYTGKIKRNIVDEMKEEPIVSSVVNRYGMKLLQFRKFLLPAILAFMCSLVILLFKFCFSFKPKPTHVNSTNKSESKKDQ